jgi:hypothetical protein
MYPMRINKERKLGFHDDLVDEDDDDDDQATFLL